VQKVSQCALGRELGIHRNTVLRWESGEAEITIHDYLRVCDLLECNVFTLLPATQFTWGPGISAIMKGERVPTARAMEHERAPVTLTIQEERDPRLTKDESHW
jgi:transcriptional regulator with XRE-family HTH domain